MRSFTCGHCGLRVYFGNSRCLRCRSPLGYLLATRSMVALTETAEGYVELGGTPALWHRCATAERTGCNWLVPYPSGMCASCSLTRTRPADDDPTGLEELVAAEAAKRRLVHQLAEIGLRPLPRNDAIGTGVAFDLLSSSEQRVVTGHADGIITLDLAEADEAHREELRLQLNEPYRTLLGHFRHEIGHYFWPILVDDDLTLAACRELFGDDRADYGDALEAHYGRSDDDAASWVDDHVSRYATMHPYEDWAETFAHYLHIVDTLETAQQLRGFASEQVPTDAEGFGAVVERWLRLTEAMNEISRSMGNRDLYPFVLSATVIRKLSFVHQVVLAHAQRSGEVAGQP